MGPVLGGVGQKKARLRRVRSEIRIHNFKRLGSDMMTKVSVSLKPRLNEVLSEKWQKVLCQSLPPRLYMLERQRRKKQRLGQQKVQRVLAATLAFHDIPNFRFTDCHGTATSSSAVDSQHLQKIQG